MSAQRYRALHEGELLVRPLDTLTLLYHRPSGQTHIVASPVPEILTALGDNALHLDALFDALAQHYDLGEPDDAKAILNQHVTDLCALGLVRIL
jgi:PqqD family protein of HPr-rel-A system